MKVYLVWRDLWWDWGSNDAVRDVSLAKVFTTKELAIDYIKSVNAGLSVDNDSKLEPLEDTWSEEELSRTIEFGYDQVVGYNRVVLYVDERELIGELP